MFESSDYPIFLCSYHRPVPWESDIYEGFYSYFVVILTLQRSLDENLTELNCFVLLGQRFAMMEMKVVLAYMLRTFKITSVTKREGIKVFFSPILRPMNGTCVKLSVRS